MKRKEIIGIITFIGFTIIWVLFFTYVMPKAELPKEGIPHNYYYPDEDVMWITNEGDTIWE